MGVTVLLNVLVYLFTDPKMCIRDRDSRILPDPEEISEDKDP